MINERVVFVVFCEFWVILICVSEGVDVEDIGGIGMVTVVLVFVSLIY